MTFVECWTLSVDTINSKYALGSLIDITNKIVSLLGAGVLGFRDKQVF